MKNKYIIGTVAVALVVIFAATKLKPEEPSAVKQYGQDLLTRLEMGEIDPAEAERAMVQFIENRYRELGDRDCDDFSSHKKAQRFFEDEGGLLLDLHKLDRNKDGVACEPRP